ncbi:DNA-binding protein [Undibacterium sp. Di26W]|uniref:DNA-binding protein n=1 Tax=Undibacterium sp. Di26W TaxID=3413035 RepID=UPI003BF204F8
MQNESLKTCEQVLSEFSNKGVSVRSWAIANNIAPSVVHSLLRGRTTGRIGASHKAAVLLGLKHGEIVE